MGGPKRTSHPAPDGRSVNRMSSKEEIRQFLVSRRANITPAQTGLPDYGGERRVPGLRREEVAELAGVSTDYYNRLERGNIQGASDSVLNAVARALQLNDVERDHLFTLARPTATIVNGGVGRELPKGVRDSVQRIVRRGADFSAFLDELVAVIDG